MNKLNYQGNKIPVTISKDKNIFKLVFLFVLSNSDFSEG